MVPVSYPGSSSSTGELPFYPCFWPSSQVLVNILTDLIDHCRLPPFRFLLRYNNVFRVSLFLLDPLGLVVHYQLCCDIWPRPLPHIIMNSRINCPNRAFFSFAEVPGIIFDVTIPICSRPGHGDHRTDKYVSVGTGSARISKGREAKAC